ncbi:MAG: hypothetical protein V1718_03865, partial [archaeon]
MKNKLIIITILLSLIALTNTALSQDPYSVNINSDKDAILAGQRITYTASITNNLNQSDITELSIIGGTQTSWVTLNDYSVELAPGETRTFRFYISPPFDTPVNKYLFRMKAVSKNDTKIFISKDINIYVIEVSKIELTTFATDKDYYLIGEKVTLTTGAKNLGTGRSKNATIKISLTGSKNDEKTIKIPPLEVEQEHIEKTEYTFDKYRDKGTYGLTGTLYNEKSEMINTKKTSFEIEKKADIQKKRAESSTILEKTIKIEAINNGNDKGTINIIEYRSKIPQIIEFENPPTEETINGQTRYTWTCELEPLDTCTITYKIKYWAYFIAAIIMIAIIYLIINIIEKPHITKAYKKGIPHTISIEIKNNSRRPLLDVQVQDMIPTIFEVLES